MTIPDADFVDRPNFDVSAFAPATAHSPVKRGVAAARAPGRGVPSLMWAPRGEPPPTWLSIEAAARLQLARHAATYGVTPEVLAAARTLFVHDTGRGGIIVALRPTVDGVDLYHGDVKLLLDRSRRLVAVSGAPHPDAHPGAAQRFELAADAAVAAALGDLHGAAGVAPLVAVEAKDGWQRFALAPGQRVRFREPARARPVYVAIGERLEPAYLVELQTSFAGRDELYQYAVAAADGRLLMRRDATAHVARQYRVYAEADGDRRPLDGPLADFNPHPTGVPGGGPDGFSDAALVTVDGLNTNPDGVPDPWVPANVTQTRGNNVDAYLDRNGTNPTEFRTRAVETAPGVLDYTYDVTAGATASDEQALAGLTHLFYVTNWLHDWWYDSGFVEATGAGQVDNYGRGGLDGDPLLAEGQEGAKTGQRNRANMATPWDGASPRMQVYVFDSPDKSAGLTAQPIDESFAGRAAGFGPLEYDLSAALVVVDDGAGASDSDGCEPPVNDVQGKIVVIDRGHCPDEEKVHAVEAAGAVGAVLVDELPATAPPVLADEPMLVDPTIPALGVTLAAGEALKAALEGQPLTGQLTANPGIDRDAALDSVVVAHEWTHFLHQRLVECGTQTCRAEGEGWGDFSGLLMSARAGDDLDGVFVLGVWGSHDASGYFNLRRVPFSVDPAVNALSFRHISDGEALPADHPLAFEDSPNSVVHNAGEIWATMLWESYVALQKAHAGDLGFDAVRRLMSDYIVAGMMLAPLEPTYTEQRDALLMAIAAHSEADMLVVAEAFARRGAGSCAVSPPRHSLDLVGVVEDFEVRARGVILSATLDDALDSCDGDGVVDVGERGRIQLEIFNGGVAALPAGALVEVVDPDPDLVFPGGLTVAVPELAPLETATVAIEVAVDDALAAPRPVALRLRLTTPGACEAPAEHLLHAHVNADLAASGASVDDVEAGAAWTATGALADWAWARVSGPDGHVWQGSNLSAQSDTALVSPPFTVAKDQDMVLSFDHAFNFEHSFDIPYDGGVIELSSDDGATWHDVAEVTGNTGYNGTVNGANNPLAERLAFVRASPDYPALQPRTIEFGKSLAGLTMRLRFRIGTNSVRSAPGWTIDNIRLEGVTAGPFPRWVAHEGVCEADDPTTGGTGGGESGSGGDPDTDGDDSATTGNADGDAGCGCASGPGGAGQLAPALGLLLLLGRRRRSSP